MFCLSKSAFKKKKKTSKSKYLWKWQINSSSFPSLEIYLFNKTHLFCPITWNIALDTGGLICQYLLVLPNMSSVSGTLFFSFLLNFSRDFSMPNPQTELSEEEKTQNHISLFAFCGNVGTWWVLVPPNAITAVRRWNPVNHSRTHSGWRYRNSIFRKVNFYLDVSELFGRTPGISNSSRKTTTRICQINCSFPVLTFQTVLLNAVVYTFNRLHRTAASDRCMEDEKIKMKKSRHDWWCCLDLIASIFHRLISRCTRAFAGRSVGRSVCRSR